MEELSKYKLLVVDDDELFRDTVSEILKEKGFSVIEADSGSKALDVIKEQRVDLILSDIQMPNGDGIFLLENVRLQDPDKPLFFFMTGFSNYSKEVCLEKGAQEVFTKPFKFEKIISEICNQLGVDC